MNEVERELSDAEEVVRARNGHPREDDWELAEASMVVLQSHTALLAEVSRLTAENEAKEKEIYGQRVGIGVMRGQLAVTTERLAAAERLVHRFYNYHTSSWSTEFSRANFMMMLLADVEAWIPPSMKGEANEQNTGRS